MEVIESWSPRFSQSDPTTASVSDQQTHTPTVEDMVCTLEVSGLYNSHWPPGLCEEATNEIVHAALKSVESELPQIE